MSCLILFLCDRARMSLQAQTNTLSNETGRSRFESASSKWIKASNTNCLIWNFCPRESETVTWSGAVVDGKAQGTGVLQWFTNGTPTTRYEGEMKSGFEDGHGIEFYFSLYSTEGIFKKGRLISKTITHRNSGNVYTGEHTDSVPNGQGEELMRGGVRYIGEFKMHRFDGTGVMIWPDGSRLNGNWKDSQLAGIGTFTGTNGETIKVKRTPMGVERAE
jgi:hypothetical protein